MPHNIKSHRPPSTDKIKHLFLDMQDVQRAATEFSPYYYAEIRIDFSDVRTGFRATVSLNKAIELYLITPDLLWAEDMIRDIDPKRTRSSKPDGAAIRPLPHFVNAGFMSQMETQFIHYLLRSYKEKVFRNFDLNAYSASGESLSNFEARCSDLLDEPKRRELDVLHDVFVRRLEQIKQKYLIAHPSDNLETAKAESQDKNLFLYHSDRVSAFFLNPANSANATMNGPRMWGNNPDLADRLESLEAEAKRAIAGVLDSYEKRARSIDEYILHPNLKDIHFVRCCILWIPVRMV
ncbi:MAG: hypothetical protein JXA73_19735 [Acidobacteria bacterium]|nr:hypothetical protein [Acidobacteriota bacterium]